MEGGPAIFRNDVPFTMIFDGKVNGQEFHIEGEGCGNSNDAFQRGKFVCTSGELPIAWAALATTLGQGYKCYARYPNDIVHFYQECLPGGWTQDREICFEGDGTLKAHHDIFYQNGVVVNKVTLSGEGFREDSPVLNHAIGCFLPNIETLFPVGNGVKSFATLICPLLNESGKGYLTAHHTTVYKPLGDGRTVKLPGHHFLRSHLEQFKDVDDTRQHVVQQKFVEAYKFSLLGSRMLAGQALSCKDLPFHMTIGGTVNGLQFQIDGSGSGNAENGFQKSKFVCTNGKLPISWAALASILGNSFKCFAKYPNGIPHFYQECLSGGWVQDSTISFEDDGTLKSRHEIALQSGVIVNKVTLEGEGFQDDSPVLNNGIRNFLPTAEINFPIENGVKSITNMLYPLTSGYGKEYLSARQTTTHTPLGKGCVVNAPGHHFLRSQVEQLKHVDDMRDHVIQHEALEAFDFKLLVGGY